MFTSANKENIPAFCNIVKARSGLVNVNSTPVSTTARIRAVVTNAAVPAALNYLIAVTSDANSGSGFAKDTVATEFADHIFGPVMQMMTPGLTPVDNAWFDKTEVTGGIKNFQKTFAYQSGVKL